MRFRHPDGRLVHLAYCTNVHPAEDLPGVLDQLARYGEPVRRALGVPRLGVGLWLAAPVVRALAEPAARSRLAAELAERGLEVVALNAFPYAGFGRAVVKHAVYRPDWTEPARLRYTVACAEVLADLLPSDVQRGSISSVPLGWRRWWRPDSAARAAANLEGLALALARVADRTGATVRVGLEPEPGCVLETTRQTVRWWQRELPRRARRWVGACVDSCHLAVAFEEPREALGRLVRAGVPVVKVQASCAVAAAPPSAAAQAALRELAGPRFLHQTGQRGGPQVDDLPSALAGGLPGGPGTEWRSHVHVPIHADLDPPLRATRSELVALLDSALGGPSALVDHLEVETYTWPELAGRGLAPGDWAPGDGVSGGLVAGIAAELAWARDQLLALGLKEEP